MIIDSKEIIHKIFNFDDETCKQEWLTKIHKIYDEFK
jgi:hypothetical protein